MNRVAVVGSGGAGKSSFAAELGERTGLPVVHLDRHIWKPGWVETPRDEWRRRQAELFAGERWIADGNYGGTFDERFSRADTVIVLALPRLTCLTGALRRSALNHGKAHAVPADARWCLDVGCGAGETARRLRQRETPAPKLWPPPLTYADTRTASLSVLPDCHFRRVGYFRYGLTWVRPDDAHGPS